MAGFWYVLLLFSYVASNERRNDQSSLVSSRCECYVHVHVLTPSLLLSLHYITLHYITLHYITLRYIASS